MSESVRSASPQERTSAQMADEDEIGHVVCCRDPAWSGGVLEALCGVESERVMLTADVVCSMCVEQLERLRPGWRDDVEDVCPVDGRACPDDLALLDLVSRRVLPG